MAVGPVSDFWPAPAKINRFLRIVGRRADGYHLLQTVFQFLDYCDYLSFEIRDDNQINRLNEIPDIAAEDDLTIRAARLLQQNSGTSRGVDITIDKNIPPGGGLGGGSSNAATALVALNHYWKTGLSSDELAGLGLQLGADVPVFVRGRSAWAEGVGERLTPVDLEEPWFLVLIPDCRVHTGKVFADPELTRDSEPITMRGSISEFYGNDCEAVVFKRYPTVAAAAQWLSHYAKPRLTGTGACVYATFADQTSAEKVLMAIPANLQGFISRGCNRSPLQKRLQRATIASLSDTLGP
jgi:4-diphosphocytidyl-2-C-methyl-D-erythritol kinase